MRKYELYQEYHDLYEYYGDNEIERIRIKGGQQIRRDWFVFGSVNDAVIFFSEKCGGIEGRYV